ncbi:RNA polymerase sigma-H factor [Paraconexibacter sp. AEG42_29]|uniref:RNA polymerase sigma-H factor n=1 Tax=Paraconexibacter sp. AEG42_29 TaxID=2997339 RepID=A0AAU7AWU9_9ACTN
MKLDAALLGDIYRQEATSLVAAVTRQTLDADLALDIVSEAFAVAFERRATFRGTSRAEAVGWLYAIARTTATDHFRRGGAERRAVVRLGVERPEMHEDERRRIEDLAGIAKLRASVATELSRLPGDQGRAVQLRVVEELSYADIADQLHITTEAARTRVSRGLRALARELAPLKELSDAL